MAPEIRSGVEVRLYGDVGVPVSKLDLLFVIDNSESMTQEQENLARNFSSFMKELETVGGGLLDLRIAITSSDVGAGPQPIGNCRPLGDRGRFLVREGCGLDPKVAHFLAVQNGGARKNFNGELAEVFACLASLGTGGCGYEHPLQAARAALSRENLENQGFLRADAHLAIVFITDEDDCSARPDSDLFRAEPQNGHSPNLRCALEGHACAGAKIPAQAGWGAPLQTCAATRTARVTSAADAASAGLIAIDEFVDYFRQLKGPYYDRIAVAGILGWSDRPEARYELVQGPHGLDVAPACQSDQGSAAPGLRLKAFVDSFGAASGLDSICEGDLSGALARIGRRLRVFVDPFPGCLPGNVADLDPSSPGLQPECQVADRIARGDGFTEHPIPPCTDGRRPCWQPVPGQICEPHGVRIDILRAGATPPGSVSVVKCLACGTPSDPLCSFR